MFSHTKGLVEFGLLSAHTAHASLGSDSGSRTMCLQLVRAAPSSVHEAGPLAAGASQEDSL